MSSDSAFLRAVALHQAGRLEQAEAGYDAIAAGDPAYADARHYLGLIAFQRGDFARAVGVISDAIVLWKQSHRPAPAECYVNLGNALKRNQQVGAALVAYRDALSVQPNLFPAWFNLALLQRETGDLNGAIASLSSAVRIEKADPRAWVELGECHARSGADSDAIRCFESALLLLARADLGGAGNPLRFRVGKCLVEMGRYDQAIGLLKPLRPTSADNVDFLNTLGCAQSGLGHLGEAEKTLRRAVSLDPSGLPAHDNLAAALKDGGQIDRALQVYRSALHATDAGRGIWSNYLMTLLYSDQESPAHVLEEHRRASSAILPTGQALRIHEPVAPRVDRAVRLGYLSADLRNHPVAYFMAGVLASHDPGRVEVHVYDNGPVNDSWTDRLRSMCPRWRRVRALSDIELADAVRSDQIDVLIELSGHTADNRQGALAYRPAPVQVSYLGYAFSTGMPWIDWRLVDWTTDPPGSETLSVERLYRLPHSYYAYSPPDEAPEIEDSPVRRTGYVTFGVSSNLAKVTPTTLDHWASILRMFPDSRLAWKSRSFADPQVRRRILDELTGRQIGRNRIRLESWVDHRNRWAFLRSIDVALDTFPYNQATNTCEALWMGVPTISACGTIHQARMGASILTAAGLADWVISADEMRNASEALRIRLSSLLDVGALSALRLQLRDRLRRSNLLDTKALAGAIETACREFLEASATDRTGSGKSKPAP